MKEQPNLLRKFKTEELDRELIARGAQTLAEKGFQFRDKEGTPARHDIMKQIEQLYKTSFASPRLKPLEHVNLRDLIVSLLQGAENCRGAHGIDNRIDLYKINDENVKRNAACIAAVCMYNDIIDSGEGFSTLRVKNYGKTFGLCNHEPFYDQPVAAGPMCTGFLVKEDVIATAGHFANEKNVKTLRVVFGYKMIDGATPVTEISNENIYRGVGFVERSYCRTQDGKDWALVKLDRSVVGRYPVTLSQNTIPVEKPLYILGYPLGLPIKYASNASVRTIKKNSFTADLDVFSGNSGSPVFSAESHDLVGMVIHGDRHDFRWTGQCWITIIYPTIDTASSLLKLPRCSKVSVFSKTLKKL